MKKLKHEELIRAALDGIPIQYRLVKNAGNWFSFDDDSRRAVRHMAAESPDYEYRVLPKPDYERYVVIHHCHGVGEYLVKQSALTKADIQIRITYDGETNLHKKVEVCK